MKPFTRTLPPLLLATLAVTSLVWAGQFNFQGAPVAGPGLYSDATFGEIVAGEFTGDLGLDVVVLDEGVPSLCMTPEVYRTAITWSGGIANDLVTMPVTGGIDRLFVTSATGLHELVWSSATGAWVTTDIDTTEWAAGRELAVGDVDGDGDLDLVGLDGNNSRGVLVRYNDGVGGFVTTNGWFPTCLPNSQVVTVDWDGDGTDEIFCITACGVEGWTDAGTAVDDFPWIGTVDLISPLDERDATSGAQAAAQGLALVVQGPTGPQYLQVWTSAGYEPARSLFSRHAVAIDTTDADNDNDSDLVLGLDSTVKLLYLPAKTGDQKANPGDKRFTGPVSMIDFGDPDRDPKLNRAGLVVADFDHDGNTEIVAPSQGSWTSGLVPGMKPYSELWFHDLLTQQELDRAPFFEISTDPSNPSDHWVGYHKVTVPEDPLQVLEVRRRVVIDGPAETVAGDQDWAGHKLRFTLWETPEYWQPMLERPLFAHDVALNGPNQPVIVELLDPGWSLHTGDELWTWVIRQVVVVNGVEVDRGPALVITEARNGNEDDLGLLAPGMAFADLVNAHDGGEETSDGGIAVGGTVPDPEPEVPPEEDDPRQGG